MLSEKEVRRLIAIESRYWNLRAHCHGVINKLSQTHVKDMPDMALNVVDTLKKALDIAEEGSDK